jgi:predicted PurR-regulated permease PerM
MRTPSTARIVAGSTGRALEGRVSGGGVQLDDVPPERALDRFVRFHTRTVLGLLWILLVVGLVLWVLWVARHVLVWLVIAIFLAVALDPFVQWLQRRGIRRRGLAAATAFLIVIGALAGLAAAFVPTLIDQVDTFGHQVPGWIDDLTKGRGRFGFLETKYHIVEKARHAVQTGGASKILTGAGTAISFTRSVLTAVAGAITVVVLTFFLLLEGSAWMERLYGLLPYSSRPRWRQVATDIYRTVGGYVSGNLFISVIAGVSSGIVLFALSVPYAVVLGLLVAILDLIPLVGATLAAILVVAVAALTQGLTAAVVVGVFFIVYQQIENHLLQPLVYGRTVQLSPLAALVAVLVGAEVAGVLGALGAIPIAGTVQVLLLDWQRHRRSRPSEAV